MIGCKRSQRSLRRRQQTYREQIASTGLTPSNSVFAIRDAIYVGLQFPAASTQLRYGSSPFDLEECFVVLFSWLEVSVGRRTQRSPKFRRQFCAVMNSS